MNARVPSNREMFERIYHDQHARDFWDQLMRFSEEKGLLEPEFIERISSNFHGAFWEIYLPKAFDAIGVALKKKRWKKRGGPDFYFENGGVKIWIEAVTCSEPNEQNAFLPPSGDPHDFESGLAPEHNIMQRLATAMSGKIEQAKRHRLLLDPGDHYIVAINGYRALNGYPHDQGQRPGCCGKFKSVTSG